MTLWRLEACSAQLKALSPDNVVPSGLMWFLYTIKFN